MFNSDRVKMVNISGDFVFNIFYECFGKRKLSARFVPKWNCTTIFNQCLDMFKHTCMFMKHEFITTLQKLKNSQTPWISPANML